MRKLSFIVASLLVFSALTPNALAAAPKSGTACTKLNQVATSGSQTLICSKSGSKLIWQVKKAASTSSQSQAAPTTAKAIVFPTPLTQFTTPLAPSGANPLTWQNIVSRFADIPAIALQTEEDVYKANQNLATAVVPHTVLVGPNTKVSVTNPDDYLKRANVLFARFLQPSSYTMQFVSSQDVDWAIANLVQTVGTKNGFSNQVTNACSKDYCEDGANAGLLPAPVIPSVAFITMGSGLSPTSNRYQNAYPWYSSGGIVIHEYAHTVQHIQFLNKSQNFTHEIDGKTWFFPTDAAHDVTPCWLQEGQVNYVGLSGSSAGDLTKYKTNRLNLSTIPTLKTKQEFYDYLYLQNPKTCGPDKNQDDYQFGYNIGLIAVEAMSAIGGFESTMTLTQRLGAGQDFATAFEATYGVNWKTGADILAQVLASEYATVQGRGFAQVRN